MESGRRPQQNPQIPPTSNQSRLESQYSSQYCSSTSSLPSSLASTRMGSSTTMASASFIAPFPSQPAQPGTTPEAFQSRHGQITNISQPFQTHTGFQTAPGVSDNKQEHIQQDIVMQQDSQNQGETDNPTAAAAYLKKHTLLAEAAKRAEMAVLMRDFEGVAL